MACVVYWVNLGISLLQFPHEIKRVLQDVPLLMVIAEGIAFGHRIRFVWVGRNIFRISSPMMCCPNALRKEHLLSTLLLGAVVGVRGG